MDISALGIKITSSGVVKTTNELNAFAKAASAARVAAKNPITVKAGGAALSKALADMQRLDKAMRGMGKGGAANLAVTGADKAIAELARFTKAVADARAKAGGGITITLKANGSAAAVKNLKEFGTAAGQARTAAAKPINLNFGTTGGGVSGGGKRPLKPILDDLDEVNKRFKFTANEGLNFSRQMADIGVTAAMGMNPLMIALQQGPQLFDIFQTAGARAGVGVGGAFRGALAAAAPFLAFAAAATVAIGAFAAGVGLVTEEINKNSDVTVTWQDVLLGAFDVIKDAISTRVTAAFEAMGLDIGQVWEDVKKYTRIAINFMIGASLAVPKLIAATYDKIGPAIGDAFWSGVNLAIKALNWLIQKSAAGVNALVDTFNSVFGTSISKVMVDGIQEAANPYRGALSALGNAGAKALVGAFTTDYIKETANALSGAAQNRARLRQDAEKGGKDIGEAAGKAASKALNDEFAKGIETAMANIKKALQNAGGALGGAIDDIGNGIADILSDAAKKVADDVAAADAARQKLADENRERAMRVIYELSDVIGGKLGDQISRLSSVLEREFPEAIEALGAAFKGLSPGLKNAFGNIGAGAQVGSSVDGIFKALGIKSSNTGAQIGGAIGSFAGPLGSIAGSIVGGLIGGLLKKTPKASATISFIAGEAMDTAISGNKAKLKAAVGQMANSIISSLSDLATQLGTELTGNASVSVGIRKGNYRVDPTGQGRTKGAGVLDFGEDQAAALAYAMLDAIKDGVLNVTGSVKTLLTLTDDLSTNVAKVQQFNSVFDELSQRNDPTGFGLGQLDKQFGKLRDIFAEAGASTEEYAKLEELFQLKRTEIINEGSRRARELEIEIMRLTGDEIGALAAERAMEKEGLDATLSALVDRRNALMDEAIAAEQARAAAEQARAAADERRQLEYRMAQVLGDEEKILTMRREDELAAVSDLNKVYLQQVHAAEAAAAAVAKAAAAQNAAVSSLQGLPGMIGGGVLGAAGNPAVMSALGMFAGGDVTGARNALAQYISNTVGTALPGATSAVQSAAIDQVIASLSPSGPVNIGRGVTTGQLGGNKKPAGNLSDGKLAQSFADAEASRVDKLDDLHSRLADAYDREKKALEDLVEPFRKVREELIAYKEDLLGGMRSPGQTLQSLQVKLMAAAASKDASVLATIPGLGRDFDSLARSRSSTKADYMRQQAFLVGIVDQAIGTAGGQVNYNEEQLQRLDKSVDVQIEMKKEQETTNELLRQLLDENKGERSEQLQLGLKIEQWTHGAHKALRGATRGGNTMEVEFDA